MKLTDKIIISLSKKLRTGVYARLAAESEGIDESTFYRWKKQGEKIFESVTDKNDEIDRLLWNSLTKTQKLKCKFYKSIRQSTAIGELVLVDKIIAHTDTDWRAALEILARRFPQRWGKRDYMRVDSEIAHKENKLKEFEDEYLSDIPPVVIKEAAKSFANIIEKARKEITSKGNKRIK